MEDSEEDVDELECANELMSWATFERTRMPKTPRTEGSTNGLQDVEGIDEEEEGDDGRGILCL